MPPSPGQAFKMEVATAKWLFPNQENVSIPQECSYRSQDQSKRGGLLVERPQDDHI